MKNNAKNNRSKIDKMKTIYIKKRKITKTLKT